MEINLLKKDKKEIEFEIGGGEDTTLGEILVFKLNQLPEVDFAAYKIEHPLTGCPRIYLRVKKGDPLKAIGKAITELKKEIAEFRALVSKLKA